MTRMRLFGPVLVMTLVGCAGTNVSLVSAKDDVRAKGFRYYQASPYLLIQTDNKGGLVSRIVMLPDPNRLVSLQPYAYFATNSSSYEFSNGVLTSGTTDIDETVLPKAVISAIETVAGALLKALANSPETREAPPPYLYKVVFGPDGTVLLRGGPPLDASGKEVTIKGGLK